MAFSNAPTQDTYSTHRITTVSDLDTYPGLATLGYINAGLTNVLPYKVEGYDTLVGHTRAGIEGVEVDNGLNSCLCRGMHVWEKSPGTIYYFVVTGTATSSRVYTSTTAAAGSWTNQLTLPTNGTGPVRFVEFIDSTNTKYLVMVDGVSGYVWTSNSAKTQITDADFPTPHVPFPVFLDGYLFLAKSGTGDIYNSNLNDPLAWTAGSFISSEMYPDDIQAIVKINNYILAIGKEGSEYFYDAANATASPLARYEGGTLPFGTSMPNSIAFNKDTVILVANNSDGEFVFKAIEGMRHEDIPAIVPLGLLQTYQVAEEVRACFVRQNGKLFYVLNVAAIEYSGATIAGTLVYSPEHKIWSRFLYRDLAFRYDLPIIVSAPATTNNTLTYVAGHWNGSVYFGTFDPTRSSDLLFGGVTGFHVYQEVIVPPQTFGTYNRKYMHRLAVDYLRQTNSSSTPNIGVSYSDDMINWSDERMIAGYSSGQAADVPDGGFPFVTQLGSFRRRKIKLTATGSMRWIGIEVDINKGQQ
jgi:hypothetical protein